MSRMTHQEQEDQDVLLALRCRVAESSYYHLMARLQRQRVKRCIESWIADDPARKQKDRHVIE